MPVVKKEKRTYADRREYLKRAVSERRRKLKLMLIEYKGGKCGRCGYISCAAVYDLHHLDETKKDFGFGVGGITRSWDRLKAEADKCILLCANCHREIHAENASLNIGK